MTKRGVGAGSRPLAFLLLVAAMLIGLVLFQVWQAGSAALARAERNGRNLSHVLESQLTATLQVADEVLLQATATEGGLPVRRIRTPDHMVLVLLDQRGVTGLDREQPSGNLGLQDAQAIADWHRQHPPDAVRIGAPVHNAGHTGWLLPVSRRMPDIGGGFGGAVILGIPLEMVTGMFGVVDNGPHGVVALLDADGDLLLRVPNRTEPGGLASLGGTRLVNPDLLEGARFLQHKMRIDNRVYTGSFARLSTFPAIVVVAQSVSDVLLGVRWMTVAVLCGLLGLLFVILLGGLQQLRQLRTLSESERRASAAAARLGDSEARYRLLAENATDMIVRLDAQGRRQYVSPASLALLGYRPEELTGISTLDYVHPDDRDIVQHRMDRVLAGLGKERGINRVFHKSGHIIWIEVSLQLVRDPVPQIVAVVRDITARKQEEDRIAWLATTDALTSLPNRRALLAQVNEALRAASAGPAHSSQVAILFIDLDHFKPVNDVHGHTAGDKVLIEVAARISAACAAEDMPTRLGGDEFAVLLPRLHSAAEAQQLAERILSALEEAFLLDSQRVDLAASIGIALFPRDGSDSDMLLRRADIAMYEAKRAGGGRHALFHPEMESRLIEEEAVRTRLRYAIASGEIVPHYQKLVDLQQNRLAGFEALARWNHPQRGQMTPDSFIPFAEQMGLIGQLFDRVLDQVCRDMRDWPASLSVAVNISPTQLQDTDLPVRVLNTLARHGIAPARLEIELTENALVKDLPTAKRIINELRAADLQVSLDDFGTGYASVSHLKELHFDKMKIDRSFASPAAWNAESERYLAVIVGIGKSLGLRITAEGIENTATLRRMTDLGCDYGQGFLFGPAEPAAKVTEGLALELALR